MTHTEKVAILELSSQKMSQGDRHAGMDRLYRVRKNTKGFLFHRKAQKYLLKSLRFCWWEDTSFTKKFLLDLFCWPGLRLGDALTSLTNSNGDFLSPEAIEARYRLAEIRELQ